jgi:hypothetical protein
MKDFRQPSTLQRLLSAWRPQFRLHLASSRASQRQPAAAVRPMSAWCDREGPGCSLAGSAAGGDQSSCRSWLSGFSSEIFVCTSIHV